MRTLTKYNALRTLSFSEARPRTVTKHYFDRFRSRSENGKHSHFLKRSCRKSQQASKFIRVGATPPRNSNEIFAPPRVRGHCLQLRLQKLPSKEPGRIRVRPKSSSRQELDCETRTPSPNGETAFLPSLSLPRLGHHGRHCLLREHTPIRQQRNVECSIFLFVSDRM